jgi:hypothetical protein
MLFARGSLEIIPRGSGSILKCGEVQGRIVAVQATLFCVPAEIRTGYFSYASHSHHRLVQFSWRMSNSEEFID